MPKTALKLQYYILLVLKLIFIALIIINLFGIVRPYVKNISNYNYLNNVAKIDNSINKFEKKFIPTVIQGKDFSHIISLVFFIILLAIVSSLKRKSQDQMDSLTINQELSALKRVYKGEESTQKISVLENKLREIDSMSSAKPKKREELIKEFMSLKKELEKSGRELAFLSVDVIDSTKMKQDEDALIIEHDFNEYRHYIEAKIKKNGYIKAAWTPDGIMICFNNIDDAVGAAQDIIDGLDYFNKNIKMMKADFAVRCGVNAGFIYFDENTPLEEISDRVIDIAGHMQKNARPNSIYLPKSMIEPLEQREGFQVSSNIIDGLEVYQWKAREKEK